MTPKQNNTKFRPNQQEQEKQNCGCDKLDNVRSVLFIHQGCVSGLTGLTKALLTAKAADFNAHCFQGVHSPLDQNSNPSMTSWISDRHGFSKALSCCPQLTITCRLLPPRLVPLPWALIRTPEIDVVDGWPAMRSAESLTSDKVNDYYPYNCRAALIFPTSRKVISGFWTKLNDVV